MMLGLLSTALVTFVAAVGIGGALYEHSVVDSAWPRNPILIQPAKHGLQRVRFWVPAHSALEIALLGAIALNWHLPVVRNLLLAAFACHAVMRVWSFVDLIPKVLAFERSDAAAIEPSAARAWVVRSMLRFPLAIATAGLAVAALTAIWAAKSL